MGARGLLVAPFFFDDDGGALVRTAHRNHWPGSRGMCTRNATIARVIRALNIRMVSEIVQDLAGGWDPGGSRGVQGGHAILRADRRGLEEIKILVEAKGCPKFILACTRGKVVPVMVTNRGQNAAPCAPAPSWPA